METKTIFNLQLTYEDALEAAKEFQSKHPEMHIWEDPRDFYGQKMTFRTDFFYKEDTFIKDLEEDEAERE